MEESTTELPEYNDKITALDDHCRMFTPNIVTSGVAISKEEYEKLEIVFLERTEQQIRDMQLRQKGEFFFGAVMLVLALGLCGILAYCLLTFLK